MPCNSCTFFPSHRLEHHLAGRCPIDSQIQSGRYTAPSRRNRIGPDRAEQVQSSDCVDPHENDESVHGAVGRQRGELSYDDTHGYAAEYVRGEIKWTE